MGLATFDLVATVAVGATLSFVLRVWHGKWNVWSVLPIPALFLLGVMIHRTFRIETALNKHLLFASVHLPKQPNS